jgi:type II secretory pathway predicted ATPase ExeA
MAVPPAEAACREWELIAMYKSFFGMRACPFGSSPDPRFLYVMPQIRETLACLQYGIAARKGFVVMTGEVGTGKTTLLKTVLSRFDSDRVSTAFVFNPRLDVLDLFEFVLTDFGITPIARTKSAMLIQLNRWLVERFRNNGVCVIVIDEAQNLSGELLEEVRLLTNLETSSEKLVQIVLAGQPELEEKLRDPSVRQLRQRVWMWCKTRSLTSQETEAYIGQRLQAAGATDRVLTDDAVHLVHAYSKGVPRLINLICEHALISAYVEQVKPVPVRIIEAAALELVLDRRPFVISPEALDDSPANGSTHDASTFIDTVSNRVHLQREHNL